MKNITNIVLFIILSGLFCVQVNACDVKRGDTAIIPDDDWVYVLNQEVLKSVNQEFTFGDDCVIQRGGVLRVLAEVNSDSVLVIYDSANQRPGGTLCPFKTIFQVSKEDFSTMSDRYYAKNSEELKKENKKVQKILEVLKAKN